MELPVGYICANRPAPVAVRVELNAVKEPPGIVEGKPSPALLCPLYSCQRHLPRLIIGIDCLEKPVTIAGEQRGSHLVQDGDYNLIVTHGPSDGLQPWLAFNPDIE